jgi:thioredoxin 2
MLFTRRALLAALACLPAWPATARSLESDVLNPATTRNFDKLVVEADEPVLLYIWAPWCGSCKRTTPEVEQAGRALRETITFATLNYDDATSLASKMRVRAVPTMILFHQGRERGRRSGMIKADKLERWITSRL